jgi:hypothetical protein
MPVRLLRRLEALPVSLSHLTSPLSPILQGKVPDNIIGYRHCAIHFLPKKEATRLPLCSVGLKQLEGVLTCCGRAHSERRSTICFAELSLTTWTRAKKEWESVNTTGLYPCQIDRNRSAGIVVARSLPQAGNVTISCLLTRCSF